MKLDCKQPYHILYKFLRTLYMANQHLLFHLFLYTTGKLEIEVKQTEENKYLVKLLNVDMPLPINILSDAGVQRILVDKKGISVTSKSLPQVDPDVFYFKKVILE